MINLAMLLLIPPQVGLEGGILLRVDLANKVHLLTIIVIPVGETRSEILEASLIRLKYLSNFSVEAILLAVKHLKNRIIL